MNFYFNFLFAVEETQGKVFDFFQNKQVATLWASCFAPSEQISLDTRQREVCFSVYSLLERGALIASNIRAPWRGQVGLYQ
jgi:hypothetical protein